MQKQLKKEIIQLVTGVINQETLSRSKLVRKLENMMQDEFNAKHAILTSSGGGGLHVALLALEPKPGDEIIVSSYTFSSPVNIILGCGAKPVYVDLNKDNLTYNLDDLKSKINKNTKGVLLVDAYGIPNDYSQLKKIAKDRKLWILSDACQSLGAQVSGSQFSDFADVVVGSFFQTKTISSGEGGVILTNSDKIAHKAKLFISHGQNPYKQYSYESYGFNYRPTEIQAAILIPQIRSLRNLLKNRQNLYSKYVSILSSIKNISLIDINKDNQHAFGSFPFFVKNESVRKKLFHYLVAKNIEVSLSYPYPLYKYNFLNADKKRSKLFLPGAEYISKHIVLLPINDKTKIKDVHKTCELLVDFFKKS